MFPDITGRAAVEDLEAKILRLFDDPFDCSGQAIRIGTSIGTAVYPDDGGDMASLLRKADSLMYEMKRR